MITPFLTLDFTTASLDSRVTFTRTTSASNPATYTDSTGVIVAATNDQPRFDFDPVSLACKGLLIEESRENLAKYSQDITGVGWTLSNASVGASITSPDGTVNMQKLVEGTGVSTTHSASTPSINVTAGSTYTYSFYAKAGERTKIRMAETNGFVNGVFDLENGTVTQGTGVTSIQLFGNGIYRCVGTFTASVSSGGSKIFAQLYTTSQTYTGDGVSGAYVWGFQAELGAFATSYIPTTSSALTRNADVAIITGTNFSDFWQASKGGAQVQAIPSTVSGIRPLVQYDDGTADNLIALRGNAADPELQIVDGGAPQVQLDAGTIVANTPYSLTGWWQTNDCKARQNSGATVSDYTATIPSVTQARLGSDGTNYLNGHLATINYYTSFLGQSIYTRRKNKVFASLL